MKCSIYIKFIIVVMVAIGGGRYATAQTPAVSVIDQSSEVGSDSVTATTKIPVTEAQTDSIFIAAQRTLALPTMALPGLTGTITPPSLPDFQDPMVLDNRFSARPTQQSIYDMPYSLTGRCYDWRRLWINTGVLSGAFVGTLFVLEMLPEDATSWNRAALQDIPLSKRWHQHVIEEGPEWDHDKFVFNYVLHPYAGAAYFMAARSNGFNFYQSLLYSTLVSTVGWEFGIEAFMERPSYQDLFITPLVGSAIGEGFYRLKRYLVDNDYRLFGSPVLGNIVAFIIDPVNEFVGLFDHNPARRVAREKAASKSASVTLAPSFNSLTVCVTF